MTVVRDATDGGDQDGSPIDRSSALALRIDSATRNTSEIDSQASSSHDRTDKTELIRGRR